MPFVNEIEEAQADEHLRELYGKIEQNLGFLPHYFKTLGAKPAAHHHKAAAPAAAPAQ